MHAGDGETVAADGIRDSDIAIVGMACRFPGADSVERFWSNLSAGKDATTFFADDELLGAGVDPALLRNVRYVKAGQVLPDVALFDAGFFAIPADEAEILDPQQRHFLECAHEALESAGYDPRRYPGSVGVYAGAGMNTYLLRNLHERYRTGSTVERYRLMLTNDKDFLATRVSYKLNLRGPSVNVNTACSTSLVTVHLACLGLLAGDCDAALAGSVHIRVPQAEGYLHQEGMILSPDGVCRAFDAKAQGTVIGNGVGVVVLKRLRDALADGDRVHAVVRGTAVNNDGAGKAGYTAPSIDGQAAVVAAAQDIAGCDPGSISYVEAHGTGTPLGDPIEIAALNQAFSRATPQPPAAGRRGRCVIGSVKTNVGHLDTAAGMAGLIKTVLMLEHRRLVPSLHFDAPNPEIDFVAGPFQVGIEMAEWPVGPTPRRAGVSSFGIGGTNAHVVIEEPPAPRAAPVAATDGPQLLVISARSTAALDRATDNLARHLRCHPTLELADVAYTLGVGRQAYGIRRALVCRDVHDAALTLALGDPQRVLTGPGSGPAADGENAPQTGVFAASIGAAERATLLERVAGHWLRGSDVDWVAFYAASPRRRVPLPTYPFERRCYWVEATGEPRPVAGATLRDRIAGPDGTAQPQFVAGFLADEIARVLGYPEGQRPGPDRNLFELGLDSLVLIEITARLGAELGRAVPSSFFVEYPTIRTFVENVAPLLGLCGAGPARPEPDRRMSRRAASAKATSRSASDRRAAGD